MTLRCLVHSVGTPEALPDLRRGVEGGGPVVGTRTTTNPESPGVLPRPLFPFDS